MQWAYADRQIKFDYEAQRMVTYWSTGGLVGRSDIWTIWLADVFLIQIWIKLSLFGQSHKFFMLFGLLLGSGNFNILIIYERIIFLWPGSFQQLKKLI